MKFILYYKCRNCKKIEEVIWNEDDELVKITKESLVKHKNSFFLSQINPDDAFGIFVGEEIKKGIKNHACDEETIGRCDLTHFKKV